MFGASSEHVASSELASVMEFGFSFVEYQLYVLGISVVDIGGFDDLLTWSQTAAMSVAFIVFFSTILQFIYFVPVDRRLHCTFDP